MPTLGSETERGELLRWTVTQGATIDEGDVIAHVIAAGTVVDLHARDGGLLRRTFLAEGESALPGTPIGIVASADADSSALESAAAHESPIRSIADGGTTMPGRTVTAHNPDGRGGTIEAGSFEWSFDEPEDAGGSETGPTPVDVVLGGLASCLSLSVRFQAEKRDAVVDAIDVTTDADPERGSVERIDATVRLETAANDETVDRIVDLAERGCHVSQLLREDLPLEIDWERR